jgi:hypothetical protein
MTAQQRHDLIKSIARDKTLSDAEALRRIAEITTPEFCATPLKSKPDTSHPAENRMVQPQDEK